MKELERRAISDYLLQIGEYKRYKRIIDANKFCGYLDENQIQFDLCIKHPLVSGCDDSSKYYERFSAYLFDEYIICKNLLVQERKGEKRKFLVITDSRKKVNLSALREAIDSKKLEFVSEVDMKELLNTTPGNVSLFNMIYDKDKKVELIMDDCLLTSKELSFHPLYNEMSIFLKPKECIKFLKLINREAIFIPIKEQEVQEKAVQKNLSS